MAVTLYQSALAIVIVSVVVGCLFQRLFSVVREDKVNLFALIMSPLLVFVYLPLIC